MDYSNLDFTSDKDRLQLKKDILNYSLRHSIPRALGALAISAGATHYALKDKKGFGRFGSVSMRIAIPLMVAIGTFSATYELTVSDAQRFPEKYGFGNQTQITPKKISFLTPTQKAMNYVYDHPFQMVVTLSLPLVGAILKKNMELKNLTFSQKIMHTRVIGQAGVLSVLLVTMAFRGYMEKRGRFEEIEDTEENN